MRASALAGGPGGSHRPPPGPICPRVAPQSSVETSVWGRAGTVELHDVSSRGEASSAVNFSFDLQEELLVKVPLYLVKGHTHTHTNHCLYFSPVLPRSIFITQEKVLLWVRGCEVSDYDIGGAIFTGTEEHLAGAADIWFHSHGLKSRIVLSPHFRKLWAACLPWHLVDTAVRPRACRHWLALPRMSLCSPLGTGSAHLAGLACHLWELPAAEDSPRPPGEALPIASYRCHTCNTAFLSPRPGPLQPLLSLL